MSRTWNGESLVNELSQLLGDTSTAFKARVLGWLNDVIFDISSRHDWGHHLTKGKKILVAEEEIQNLEVLGPTGPSVALASDGQLSSGSTYKVLVTYIQSNGIESMAYFSNASASLVTTDTMKKITLSNIDTSDDSLVVGRNIYLKKDSSPFFFYGTIDDNFTTDYTVDKDVSSTVEPPDYEAIRKLKGSPFFEGSPSNYLDYRDIDQLRKLIEGQWNIGDPEYFSPVEVNSITLYPIPSRDLEISFNFYRNPFKLYNDPTSQPDLPIYLKPALKAGVIAMGYEYRDRAGQELKRANYENSIVDAINRGGRVANIEYTVRDVYGNFNGIEVG